MTTSILGVVHLSVGLTLLAVSQVSAQEPPITGYEDAQTTVANWLAGRHSIIPLQSANACPDEHPWYRAVVDGLAAVEPTDYQVTNIGLGWPDLLTCNDGVVNRWYGRALGFATSRAAGQAVAKGLVISNRPEHLAALQAAIVGHAVSDVVRGGILLGVNEVGTLSLRADIFLLVLRQGWFPPNRYFDSEVNQLMRSEIKEEFMAAAAEAVRTRPESSRASLLLTHLANGAVQPPGSPYAVSDTAARNLLRVIDELKDLPAVAAARVRGGFGGAYERQIRQRLAGG